MGPETPAEFPAVTATHREGGKGRNRHEQGNVLSFALSPQPPQFLSLSLRPQQTAQHNAGIRGSSHTTSVLVLTSRAGFTSQRALLGNWEGYLSLLFSHVSHSTPRLDTALRKQAPHGTQPDGHAFSAQDRSSAAQTPASVPAAAVPGPLLGTAPEITPHENTRVSNVLHFTCSGSRAILALNFWKILSSLDSCFAMESSSSSGASAEKPAT